MTRMTAKDFPQELLELYDYYAHGKITKREFLDRPGKFAVGGVTAAAILASLSPDYALATQVEFTDPDHGEVTFTAVIRRRSFESGEESIDAREFSGEVARMNGRWRVARIVAIDTLR